MEPHYGKILLFLRDFLIGFGNRGFKLTNLGPPFRGGLTITGFRGKIFKGFPNFFKRGYPILKKCLSLKKSAIKGFFGGPGKIL